MQGGSFLCCFGLVKGFAETSWKGRIEYHNVLIFAHGRDDIVAVHAAQYAFANQVKEGTQHSPEKLLKWNRVGSSLGKY